MKEIAGKKILILGGSSDGVETVRNANDMGLKTIVVDPVPDSPAKKIAWKSYDTDALDLEALVRIGKAEKVDGVFVGLSERLLETYCRLCERLSLPCYCTMEQIHVFCNKIAFKNKCREYGIPVVNDYSPEDELPYPVLVKPADSSGSKGISVCHNREELLKAIDRAKGYSHTQSYLIEDYLQGDQLTANYTVIDGEPYLSLINDRYVVEPYEGLGSFGIAVAFPSKNAELYMRTIHANMCRMLKDLGFQNAPINLQAFVDGDVIRFYDPALRIGGGRAYLITENITGFSIQKALLHFAVTGSMLYAGEKINLHEDDWRIKGKYSLQPNLIVRTGTVGTVEGMDQIRSIPGLIAAFQMRVPGEKITLAGTSQQTAVRLYFVADTMEELLEAYRKVTETVRIKDDNGEDMMLPPFDFRLYSKEYIREEKA